MGQCYQAGWDWCPGSGLLDRKKANGRGAAEDLAREYQKDREKLSLVQIKDHNAEIARAAARGYALPTTQDKHKALRAERIAFERESRRQPPSWPKWWLKPTTIVPPKTVVLGCAPEHRLILKHGSEATPTDYKHAHQYERALDAVEIYNEVCKYRNVAWARLLKFDQGPYQVEYGLSSVLPKLPGFPGRKR